METSKTTIKNNQQKQNTYTSLLPVLVLWVKLRQAVAVTGPTIPWMGEPRQESLSNLYRITKLRLKDKNWTQAEGVPAGELQGCETHKEIRKKISGRLSLSTWDRLHGV